MNRIFKGFLLLLALVPWGGVLFGTDRTARVVAEGESSVVLELVFPAPRFEWTGDEGLSARGGEALPPRSVCVSLDGAGSREMSAGLLLPLVRERIAVPPGAQVSLDVEEVRGREVPLARTGLPREALDALRSGRAAAPAPRTRASLGSEGALRFQSYRPVEVYPVVWEPAAGRFHVAERVRIRVSWAGSPHPGAAAGAASLSDAEREFEPLYSFAFPNAKSARAFRGGPGAAPPRGPVREEYRPDSAARLERAPVEILPRDGGAPRPRGLASNPVKLSVVREAIYRVRGSDLQAAGIDLTGVDPGLLRLRQGGNEVPMHVEDAGAPAVFDADDFIEFYGRPLVGESDPTLWESGDYTDRNVYWLDAAAAPPARVATRDVFPDRAYPIAPDHLATARFERERFFHGKSFGAGVTHWLDDTIAGPTGTPWLASVPLPGLNPASARLSAVRWEIAGRTELACDPDHHAVLCAGGTDADCVSGATRIDEALWDNLALVSREVTNLSPTILSDPLPLRLHLPGPAACAPGSPDLQNLDFFEVDYPRTFDAQGDALFAALEPGPWRIAATGFTVADATRYIAYDVTDPGAPVRLLRGVRGGTGPYTVTFDDDLPVRRVYALAAFPTGSFLPESIVEDPPSGLAGTAGADVIVLTGRPLTGSAAVDDFVAHRLRMAPARTVRVVDVEDVYDEFSNGILDPWAIRRFLEHALQNWSPVPSALVILGDGSLDTKDNFGIGGAVVPLLVFDKPETNRFLGYFGSDTGLAAVLGGDVLPDLFVGRLPARSAAELQVMVDKTVGYETASPSGSWRSHALLTNDRSDGSAVENDAFLTVQNRIEAELFRPPHTFRRLDFGSYPLPPAGPPAFRDDMVAEINSGAVINTFIGHGNLTTLGDDSLFTNYRGGFPGDVSLLTNGGAGPSDPGRLPLLVHANCLTGAVMNPNVLGPDPVDSVVESFLKTPGRGAWAAVAPLGLVTASLVEPVVRPIFDGIYGDDRERVLGRLVMRSLLDLDRIAADDVILMMAAFGDPEARLLVPSPSRPTGLGASPGDARVDLAWTASPPAEGIVSYGVYRSQGGENGNYTKIGDAPGPSFPDTTVSNSTTYWYRVTAVDAAGFESGRSVAVEARPCTIVPPGAPVGISIVNGGDGASLDVSWAARPADEEVLSYRIRYGPIPGGPYPSDVTVGGTGTRIGALTEGQPVYLVVSSIDVCGLESGPSPEMTATPRLDQGTPMPAMVLTLRVMKAPPADLRLEWDAVEVDTYGNPITLASYEIYRSAVPDFPLSPATLVATLACPPCTGRMTWTDFGALAAAGNYHYLVVARDASGETSGASNDLPRGIRDLRVAKAPAGTLDLTWSPVTLDLQGNPTVVREYRAYGAAQPVLRTQIRVMTPLASVPASPARVTDAVSFLSVFAVDARGNLSPY